MSGLHLTARTVTDVITHLPGSMQPVESTVDCLQGLGDSKMASHRVIMERPEDQPLGVQRIRHYYAVSFPP